MKSVGISQESFRWLQRILGQLYTYDIDTTVQDGVERAHQLGSWRTLDAIHFATCLLLQRESEDLRLVTFDERMKATAAELKFQLA